MKKLTNDEEQALRYYIGDVSGNDSFYGDPKAYVTLNSLFFPDILSESARSREGKLLNPAIIADTQRLLGFFEALFSAFGKAELPQDTITYRVERASDFELCRESGATISMTSTSLSGFLDHYRDRRGIALMRFILPKGGHFINAAEMLGYYAKPEEAEILLPPFTRLEISENKLTDTEMLITDCDGAPPEISVTAYASGTVLTDISDEETTLCRAGERVYMALNSGNSPDAEDTAEYSLWKKKLRSRLCKMYSSCC